MTKAPSPLLGYNNNVRHKNRVFHIQTEDSGIKHPHIITHIFMDGGRILKSVKTSYGDHVGDEKLGDIVRQMMKDQHKAMFRALRDGDLDRVVDDALAGRKPSILPPKTLPRSSVPPSEAAPSATKDDGAPATLREPDGPPLTLDLDNLDQGPASFKPQQDLPPPPENILKGKEAGTGRYRTLEDREERPSSSRVPPKTKSERPAARAKSERPPRTAARQSDRPRTNVREERPARSTPATRRDPRAEPPSEPKQPVASKQSARPAPHGARPAASFGQTKPQSSIFGEDIISDKSLDEVILSYLAEDLEEKS